MDHNEIGCKLLEWINVAEDMDRRRDADRAGMERKDTARWGVVDRAGMERQDTDRWRVVDRVVMERQVS